MGSNVVPSANNWAKCATKELNNMPECGIIVQKKGPRVVPNCKKIGPNVE